MFIIDKYILRRSVGPFLYCFSCFAILAMLVDLFEHGDEMIEKSISAGVFFRYYFYYICAALPQIMPMAVLLAVLFIISAFIRHNELTAMQSGGIHLARFVGPFILLALLISLLVIVINEAIATQSARKINEIKKEYLYFETPDERYEHLAKIGEGNKMYLMEKYHKKQNLMTNLLVLEFDESQSDLKSRTNAKECVYDNNHWVASRGSRVVFDKSGNIIEQETFDAQVLDIREKPEYFDQGKKDSSEMTYPELSRYIRKLKQSKFAITEDLIDLYNKLALPFATLFVVLVGIPAAFMTRMGALMNFSISMALGLAYVMLFSISVAFGRAGLLPPFLASWLANGIFGITGIILMFRKTR